jgi:hypothetical protein
MNLNRNLATPANQQQHQSASEFLVLNVARIQDKNLRLKNWPFHPGVKRSPACEGEALILPGTQANFSHLFTQRWLRGITSLWNSSLLKYDLSPFPPFAPVHFSCRVSHSALHQVSL